MDRYKEKILMLQKLNRIEADQHILFIIHERECPFIQKAGECNCPSSIQAHDKKRGFGTISPVLLEKLVEEEGFKIIHGQAVNGSSYYEPPETNLNCLCYPNMMQTMFCMQGHLTECHVGMNCSEAKCSHLSKYQ